MQKSTILILFKGHSYITQKYPENDFSKFLNKLIFDKKSKILLLIILFVLELIWLIFAYLGYKNLDTEYSVKTVLFLLYLMFDGGLLWSYVLLVFCRKNKKEQKCIKNNKLGLIKYLLLIPVEIILLILMIIAASLSLGAGQNSSYELSEIENILIVAGIIVIPIIHFIFPVIWTILAIKEHWSEYLDKFFNQLKLPTIVLFLVALVVLISNNIQNINSIFKGFLLAIFSIYFLIYLVILVNNICKKVYKNK